jgi:hypothetical protein
VLADRLRALGLHVERTDGAVEVELTSKPDALRILETIAENGLQWESFSTQTDTLEDVFIQLVGRIEDDSLAGTNSEAGR